MKIDKLKPGSWAVVLFAGYKTHFCPSELAGDLIADIEARGGETVEMKETKEGRADLPGIVSTNRVWEDIEIGEFKLGFPSLDFEYFMEELGRTPLRKFGSGKEYYKIHGWLHCVVLTPEQRIAVLAKMAEMLPDVRKHAEKEDKEFLEAMEQINKGKLRVVSCREAELRGEAMRVTIPPKGEKN